MKELEIIIKQDFGMWRMSIKCEANLANTDRKSTRLNSSHIEESRMPSSA